MHLINRKGLRNAIKVNPKAPRVPNPKIAAITPLTSPSITQQIAEEGRISFGQRKHGGTTGRKITPRRKHLDNFDESNESQWEIQVPAVRIVIIFYWCSFSNIIVSLVDTSGRACGKATWPTFLFGVLAFSLPVYGCVVETWIWSCFFAAFLYPLIWKFGIRGAKAMWSFLFSDLLLIFFKVQLNLVKGVERRMKWYISTRRWLF